MTAQNLNKIVLRSALRQASPRKRQGGEALVDLAEVYRLWRGTLSRKAARSLGRFQDVVFDTFKAEILARLVPAYTASGEAPGYLNNPDASIADALAGEPIYVPARALKRVAADRDLDETAGGFAKWWFGDLWTPLVKALDTAFDYAGERASRRLKRFNAPHAPKPPGGGDPNISARARGGVAVPAGPNRPRHLPQFGPS